MQCSRCQGENLADAGFCQHCGERLALICSSCSTANTVGSNFCRKCGTRLVAQTGSAAPSTGLSPGQGTPVADPYVPQHLAQRFRHGHAAFLTKHAGERKIITALFADIQSSMALLDAMDPDLAQRVIDPALRLMMNAVYRYEGYVSSALGDGIFAFFGAPIAREDHARVAIYAALSMQERMKAYGTQLLREHGLPPIQLRVGINTGEVVVRSIPTDDLRAFYDPVGHSTGLAARIQSIAAPGSVLVSESTRQLTGGYFEFRALGSVPMKGVKANINLHEVAGIGPLRTRLEVSASHGLAEFIGRRSELDRMHALFELAKTGEGQIIGVVGDVGVGKSRLFHEFKQGVGDDCLILEGSSASFGKAFPYLPLIEMLKSYLQIAAGEDDRSIAEKVSERALALDRDLEDTIPFLLALLGVEDPAAPIDNMDPQIRRRRIFNAIQRLVLREARRKPVLMVVEDLHWLDEDSQSFLTMFGGAVAGAAILLLVNYRREYQPAWGAATSQTQLRLNAFGPDDADALLTDLLGDDVALAPLKRLVIDNTQGNPFFMEEYVRTLFDQGILTRGDKIELTRMPSKVDMPATVQGVLTARIDRLQPEHKEFLQLLAVLGMASPLGLIARVTDRSEEQLQEMLDHLQGAEFIYQRPAFPDVEYGFRHALTREAAYGQLLLESRRALHSRAAQAMEVHFSDCLDDYCSELAHHYACSDNLPKAVDFLQRAASQAMQRSAYVAAIDHVTSALGMLPGLSDGAARDRREVQLQSMLGSAWMATRGFAVPEVSQAYGRARDLCRDTTDNADLIRALGGLGLLHINRGELQLARDIGEQLLGLAERRQDSELLVTGHELLGMALLRTGDLDDCRMHMERAIRLYEHERHEALRYRLCRDPAVSCFGFGALGLWLSGHPDQAVAWAAQAMRIAHSITPRHPFSLAYAMLSSAWVHQFRGEASLALQEARAAIEFSNEQGFPAWLLHGQIIEGWAEAELGETEKGIAHIDQALLSYKATGATVWQPLFLLLRGRALTLAGKIAEALELVTTAQQLAAEMSPYWWEAELFRVKGEMLLALAEENAGEAQTCFERALAVARKQGAKSLELRACVSMTRLARAQGRGAEAAAELTALYEWFTEGFNTAELTQARELIKEMS